MSNKSVFVFPAVLMFVSIVVPPAFAQFDVPYGVVAGGGGNTSSANYAVHGTAGQSATGEGASNSFGAGAGYWYFPAATATAVGGEEGTPKVFSLFQNYPNPFNPATTIRFAVPKRSFVTLRVYDVSGALVATLIDKEMPSGVHRAVWDAQGFASGVYFYRIRAEGFAKTRKLVILK